MSGNYPPGMCEPSWQWHKRKTPKRKLGNTERPLSSPLEGGLGLGGVKACLTPGYVRGPFVGPLDALPYLSTVDCQCLWLARQGDDDRKMALFAAPLFSLRAVRLAATETTNAWADAERHHRPPGSKGLCHPPCVRSLAGRFRLSVGVGFQAIGALILRRRIGSLAD